MCKHEENTSKKEPWLHHVETKVIMETCPMVTYDARRREEHGCPLRHLWQQQFADAAIGDHCALE